SSFTPLHDRILVRRIEEGESKIGGFSLAESGMMMPPILLSPSSMRRTRIRSCSGVNDDVAIALHLHMRFVANGFSVRVVLRDQPRQPRRNLPQRSWRNLANRSN